MIELKFCSLNQNLDKNIIDRGYKESIIIPLDMIHDIETEKNEDNNDDDCSRDINNTDDNSSFLWF